MAAQRISGTDITVIFTDLRGNSFEYHPYTRERKMEGEAKIYAKAKYLEYDNALQIARLQVRDLEQATDRAEAAEEKAREEYHAEVASSSFASGTEVMLVKFAEKERAEHHATTARKAWRLAREGFRKLELEVRSKILADSGVTFGLGGTDSGSSSSSSGDED